MALNIATEPRGDLQWDDSLWNTRGIYRPDALRKRAHASLLRPVNARKWCGEGHCAEFCSVVLGEHRNGLDVL